MVQELDVKWLVSMEWWTVFAKSDGRRDRIGPNKAIWLIDEHPALYVAKAKLKQNQYGARFGGPILIPGLFDGRNKAFFFVNYEEFRQPSDMTRNRTILSPSAQAGTYNYGSGSVNVLSLAAALDSR